MSMLPVCRRGVLRGKVIATLGASSSIAADRLHEATFNDVAEEYIVEHQNKLEALVVQRQKHWNRLQPFASVAPPRKMSWKKVNVQNFPAWCYFYQQL